MENENPYCKFGTALKQYEKNEIPSKKPINVEDEIVTDINGKRRFHGAFTGGFSAGYWNTVDTAEGWKPQQFKSSRKEKASAKSQAISDFMDDEDVSEFGFAPQRVQTKTDFSDAKDSSTSLSIHQFNLLSDKDRTIHQVLEVLTQPRSKDRASIRILKYMGWKTGHAIGARPKNEKKKTSKTANEKEQYLMEKYGCELNVMQEKTLNSTELDECNSSDDEEDSISKGDIAPIIIKFKDNVFGLGYSGLEGKSIVAEPMHNILRARELVGKNRNKLPIAGQAFGVGALEEEDEDIYSRDDLTQYDFILESKKDKKKPEMKAIESATKTSIIDGFVESIVQKRKIKRVFKIELPPNFVPRNWLHRKSRFEPLDAEIVQQLESDNAYKKLGLGRHDLNPDDRKSILNKDDSNDIRTQMLNLLKNKNNFVHGETLHNDEKTSTVIDKSGISNSQLPTKGNEIIFTKPNTSKPEWMKALDKEFVSSGSTLTDRFESESSISAAPKPLVEPPTNETKEKFETIVKKSRWEPHKDLCIRFNIPEPFNGIEIQKKAKRTTSKLTFDFMSEEKTFIKSSEPEYIELKNNYKHMPDANKIISTPHSILTQATVIDARTLSREKISAVIVAQEVSRKSKVKKSELELKVLENINKKPEDKVDLYKFIFCALDSEKTIKFETPLSFLNKEPVVPVVNEQLPDANSSRSTEVNVLRNDSPARGVFKNFFENNNKITDVAMGRRNARVSDESTTEDEYEGPLYGPVLPDYLIKRKKYNQPTENVVVFQPKRKIELYVEPGASSIDANKKKKLSAAKERSSESLEKSSSSDDKLRKKKSKKSKKKKEKKHKSHKHKSNKKNKK